MEEYRPKCEAETHRENLDNREIHGDKKKEFQKRKRKERGG